MAPHIVNIFLLQQVMQFAEASQEIMVKPTPMKTDFSVGLTPGRRRANQVYEMKKKK